LLGVGAHLGNVLPDIDSDLATGVHGWPQRLGRKRARRLLPVALVAASAVLTLGAPGPFGAADLLALAVAALTAAGGEVFGRQREKVPFIASIIVAGVDVALLMWQGV
jgi:1,4-dihydroxy-2-naphthoate octaprenyltransferase